MATTVVAQCPCGENVREFWISATNANPTNAQAAGELATTVTCPTPAMLCICLESGACCTPGTRRPPPSVQFIPYCDAAGNCHMYAVLQGDRDTTNEIGVECSDGSVFLINDQFLMPEPDPTMHNLDETTPTGSLYKQAQSVCCGGCKPIGPANEVCTGPATPV